MKKLIFGFIILIVGYIIGTIVPLEYLKPNIIQKDLNSGEFYTIVINSFSVIVTTLAVIVALFKEDIRKYWEFASLDISFKDGKELHEILEDEKTNTPSNINKATKYESVILIANKGKLPARNCELYLERLTFKNSQYVSNQDIPIVGIALEWWGKNERTILIPSTGKAYIGVCEIYPPQDHSFGTSESSPSETSTPIKPKILFGNVESPSIYESGTWEAIFVLYSENAKPVKFTIEITWNGEWKHRLADMSKKCVDLNLKNKTK
jgi:hypothetical protein